MTDFFLPGAASDVEYVAIRDTDQERVLEAKAFIEHMWSTCAAFLDSDLPQKARNSFKSAFWELYLAFAFHANDVHLVPRRQRHPAKSGPDLLIADPLIWAEAVAPGPGEGADRVPDLLGTGETFTVPDEQLKLRLRSAIEEKHQRFLAYEERGWIKPGEPAIVAVSGAALGHTYGELNVPRIVRVAFPIGHEQIHIDVSTHQVVGRSHQYSPTVRKQSGGEVSTELFLSPAYSRISALLYSASDPFNRPKEPGADLILVLNPYAAAPIQPDRFHFMHQYHAEGEKVHYRPPGNT